MGGGDRPAESEVVGLNLVSGQVLMQLLLFPTLTNYWQKNTEEAVLKSKET